MKLEAPDLKGRCCWEDEEILISINLTFLHGSFVLAFIMQLRLNTSFTDSEKDLQSQGKCWAEGEGVSPSCPQSLYVCVEELLKVAGATFPCSTCWGRGKG